MIATKSAIFTQNNTKRNFRNFLEKRTLLLTLKIGKTIIMDRQEYTIRNAKPDEFEEIGKLLVTVYSQLDGFPKHSEQPAYYNMLSNIGELTTKPETELLVAVSPGNKILGAVVFFSDMLYYGSGGTANKEKNAAGFRLLAVDPSSRGLGIGKLLTKECIRKTKEKNLSQLIIHSTKAMQTAWKMYENLGFKRSEDLNFLQGELPVFWFPTLVLTQFTITLFTKFFTFVVAIQS